MAAAIGVQIWNWHVPEEARLYGAAQLGPIVLKE